MGKLSLQPPGGNAPPQQPNASSPCAQVQVMHPKHNRGTPYRAALMGGARTSFVLPPLLNARNRLGQALAILELRVAPQLERVQAAASKLLALLTEGMRALSEPSPKRPSPSAAALSELMQPKPPPELLVEIGVYDAALHVAAYILQPRPGAEPLLTHALYAAKPLEDFVKLRQDLSCALELVRALQPKLSGWA